MAQYRLHDQDDWVACPYDSAELMLAMTLPYHLSRCPKKHNAKYATCPFNASHKIPKAEIRHHLTTCPARAIIEPELGYAQRKVTGEEIQLKGCTDTPRYSDMEIPSTEDWDAETKTSYYVRPSFGNSSLGSYVDFRGTSRSDSSIKHGQMDHQNNGWHDNRHITNDVERPQPQPVDQPISSVFAYSIGRGRARGRGQGWTNSVAGSGVGQGTTFPPSQYGRGSAQGRGREWADGTETFTGPRPSVPWNGRNNN